uniref:Uncharacterized protein n=1 Tax=Anguilla anguilla TaxID=7936 RepID=A0A0E9SK33_ANGAN
MLESMEYSARVPAPVSGQLFSR